MYTTWINDENILAITTDNQGGVSTGAKKSLNFGYHVNDNKKAVDQNFEILANVLNIDVKNIYFAQQTHSSNIVKVDQNTQMPFADTDALYTNVPNHYIGVMTADCLPILLFDSTTNIVAAIHAGWAGSAKTIAYLTVKYLIENEGLNPLTTKAMLGPSILKSSYEVDDYVKEKVYTNDLDLDLSHVFENKANGKYWFDNRLFNIKQLEKAGIVLENITDLAIDTFSDDNYFSYRQSKETGRQLSLIGLKPTKINYRKYFKTLTINNRTQQSKDINQQLLKLIQKNNYQNILAFIPMDNEPDLKAILELKDVNIYVPRVFKDLSMQAIKYDENTLTKTTFGCYECISDDVIEADELDLIIVPAVAFDKHKHRLGHGKGFYDRYLPKATKAKKIGLCLKEFYVDYIPTNEYDVLVDLVITSLD